LAYWFNQVLDGLSLNKVSICGHSNSGFQVMLIAQQNPDKIEKLILLAPAAGFKSFSFKFYLSAFGTAIFPKVIMLPDCGQAIPFDAPKEASNAIDLFLSVE
jgi:pimeloyl-ACP methyl ester carboxylesterase